MEKTNFTLVRQWLLVPFMLFMAYSSATAQCVLACNDGVQVSVDPSVATPGACSVTLTPDMILENYEAAINDCAGGTDAGFTLQVLDGPSMIASGTATVSVPAGSQLGETLTVKVLAGGNSCWGSITIEDKAGPVITCPTDTTFLQCFQDYSTVPFPSALDNCTTSALIDVQLNDVLVNTDNQCDAGTANGVVVGGTVIVKRTFTAFDASGNEAAVVCDQFIILSRPSNVDFPEDIAWYCADYAAQLADATPNDLTAPAALTCSGLTANADLGGALDGTDLGIATQSNTACLNTSGSGVPAVSEGTYCFYASSHSDQTLATCGDSEVIFKILRTWTIIDWCTGGVVTSGYNDANNNGIQDAGESTEDNLQIIKVVDDRAPIITMADQVVAASVPGQHPQPCASQSFLPFPNVTDHCNGFTTRIFTPAGEVSYNTQGTGGFIPAPGLSVTGPAYINGVAFDASIAAHAAAHTPHLVTYQSTDDCGNVDEITRNLYVIDNIAPTAVCDEITDVNLSSDGFATVNASTFDDGSNDNCCIDRFEVRKMTDICAIPGNTAFGETVTFCCAEAGMEGIVVVFRVYDCYGNFNDCMVTVNVSDKLPPYKVQDVADFNIDCDVYYNNLEVALDLASADGNDDPAILNTLYGRPVYADNCDTIVDHTFAVNINSCGEGTITRTWTVEDGATPANVGPTCQQLIIVKHVNNWEVAFPDDVTLECTEGMNPGEDEDLFGEPTVFFDDCELVAVAQEDQIFNIVPDACYKIIRTYTAINWCVYDGADEDVNNASTTAATTAADNTFVSARRFRDGTNGIIVYQQVIKVLDTVAPELTCPTLADVPVNANCVATVDLPEALATDCSFDVTITATTPNLGPNGATHIGTAPIGNVAPGTYTTTYTATDNCGNSESCQMTFSVVDNKPPTPYCVGGLVVELMPVDTDGDGNADQGMVDIWASDFDAGSFDNCPGAVKLTVWLNADNYAGSLGLGYSDAPTNLNGGLPIACDSPFDWNFGNNDVYLYVEDASGNVDFCITTLVIESNPNIPLCDDEDNEDATIAGAVNTADAIAVEGVNLELSGNGMATASTNNAGDYTFANVNAGYDYTVTPSLDTDYLEGVTTYDIVLIQRHILTTQELDNNYKVIAADVNASGSITGADLVALKKVILQIDNDFANNTSWRFVDAAYNFPTAWTLGAGFPEVANFNNLTANQAANFVAVKVGDVNASWNGLTSGTEERNAETLVINTADVALTAGQEYTVEFTSADFAAVGYQFTMNFENLELVNIVEGVATAEDFGVFANAITTSWAGKASNDVLFGLTFKATADVKLSEALTINSSKTVAEAYSATDAEMNVELRFNGQTAGEGFALYQNTPNPVKDVTTVGFDMPVAGAATITVRDMTGKVITTVNGEYAKGYNNVTLSGLANGVLTYTLETANFTATRSMVVVK